MEKDSKKKTIMVVDDIPENIDVLVGILGKDYLVKVAPRGKIALHIAMKEPIPDLILLDVMMPEMDGYEVCQRLKENPLTQAIPIIFVTAKDDVVDESRGFEVGAVDYITKPVSPPIVKARVHTQLMLKLHRDHLEELVRERTRELRLTQEITLESLGTLAEYRDPETGGHIKRTQNYLRVLAEKLKSHPKFEPYFSDETLYWLYISSPLHDIGKVGVPDHILMKPGILNAEEWEEMKRHTIYGRDTIIRSEEKLGFHSFLRMAREIAYTHHEKYDGSGYPQGLKGDDIPVCGRLMAMADVYDALISKRVYKPPFSHEQTVEIITKGDGRTNPSHFDPDILHTFLEVEQEFKKIALQYADYDEERKIWGL